MTVAAAARRRRSGERPRVLRALLVVACLGASLASAQAVLVDRVVAAVDGRPILRSQVKERLRPRLVGAGTPEDRARLEQAALDELIDEALVARDAASLELEVSAEEVDRALAEVASANELSAEQLEREVLKQGYTMAGYRRALRHQLLAFRWLRARAPSGQPEDKAELGAWLDAQRQRLVAELRARATIEVMP